MKELMSIIYVVDKIVEVYEHGIVAFKGSIWLPVIESSDKKHQFWCAMAKSTGPELHIRFLEDPQSLIGTIRVTSYGEIISNSNPQEHNNKIEKLINDEWVIL